jgi:hypothetical protein
MKLPYCIPEESARVERSSRVGMGREADVDCLRLAPAWPRPIGAVLLRKGLLSSTSADCW